jgi:hypothetical protein
LIADVLADADGDGVPDTLDPGDTTEDADGDGFRDEFELAAGTDPDSSSSRPALGNVNGDNASDGGPLVDISDIVTLVNANIGVGALAAPANADINGDAVIDVQDVLALANFGVGATLLPAYTP